MPRPILACISVSALSHNLSQVRKHLDQQLGLENKTHVWAVIKANAYGHGIKQAVQGFALADGLAMIDINDLQLCRELDWQKKLHLLEGFFETSDLKVLQDVGASTTIHSHEQLAMIAKTSMHKPIDIMIKINTGMNRLGFAPDEFLSVWQTVQDLQKAGKIAKVGVMTHFANADGDAGVEQAMALFNQTVSSFDGMRSVCNSAATLRYPLVNKNTFENWVRPGICLYGASPFAEQNAASFGLRPAMTLSAHILSIQHLKAGDAVGYGSMFTADKNMKIATVACGYADGYPRHAPSGTPVMINGIKSHTVGRVSMDMLAVSLENVPYAQVGDAVVLWGEKGPYIDEVAKASGTIGYELMCALANRVPRQMV